MKKLIISLTISVFIVFTPYLYAADGYVDIEPAQPTQTGDKIEVLEVFWYACPHCYEFEPYLHDWLANKPDDVEFRRMPGIFRKSWIPHARAFFTAEKLGVLDTVHSPLFSAIHKHKKNIHDDSAIRKFFIKQGIDDDEFKKVYQSEETETKVKQAYIMGQRYKITGVPAVIVNGKYMVTGSTAGSFSNLLKIVDQLVDKERASTAN
ncbi:MAG: thiol:disulfide interchange protein DsbA/DsbL [Proteobacteria bacterium]|nr:thiol:disulfide interchange protein DsbA/DsbL [Pseudomonadota bacterium]